MVIGGGITGVSTALHLAEKGVDVALLESRHFGWGASGRSGGQIIVGYSAEQQDLEKLVGMDSARELWRHSVAAVEWTRRRIAQHHIDCDLTSGYLHVGVKRGQAGNLQKWAGHLAKTYDYQNLEYLDGSQLRQIIGSKLYSGAVSDSGSGHLHPLNYCLGLARAAQQAGARLYQDSAVIRVESSASSGASSGASSTRVDTEFGSITCDQVVYACNAYLGRLQPHLAKMIMPVGTYIIATEPLREEIVSGLIANRAAVADTNLVLDYYRLSADNRMLFGGRVSYSTLEPAPADALAATKNAPGFSATGRRPHRFFLGGLCRNYPQPRAAYWPIEPLGLVCPGILRTRHGLDRLCRRIAGRCADGQFGHN